jgi:hypothetical protein
MEVDDEGYIKKRILPDGRQAVVFPLTFGRARMGVGPAGANWSADEW